MAVFRPYGQRTEITTIFQWQGRTAGQIKPVSKLLLTLLVAMRFHEQRVALLDSRKNQLVSGPVAAGVKMPKRRIIEGERKYRVVGSFGLL